MKISTKAYGIIEVDERQKITFPAGLFGFESIKEYFLLDAERQPFYWLQSVESAGTAFVLISPFLFRSDYELNVEDNELADIDVSSPDTALVFSIVTIPADGSPMTANLQGPIVINKKNHSGKQLILSDPRWKTKHNIMQELSDSEDGGASYKITSPEK
ncbi:flagellar assembly factor FliW [Spirochaetia bacterium]|nr:flagellar assembly factor FliW [Spirochaetia bacterium]